MKVVTNCDFYKGSLYYRRRISHKHLITAKQKAEIKKCLRPCTRKYYNILLNNKEELIKLIAYLNSSIDRFLQIKGKVYMQDIYDYIYTLCQDYYEEAIKENCELEVKRINDLEYINENGVQAGYGIQALSKEYKEIFTQYNNLSDTSKTIEMGTRIVKRSNISRDKILEIDPKNLIYFYEMLIKAEKSVIENDIKTYIRRNLFQFKNLITDLSKSENEKVEEAFYSYLTLIYENEPQINYLSLVNKQKVHQAELLNKDEILNQVFEQMKIKEEDKLLNTQRSINSLIENFIEFKRFDSTSERKYRLSLGYLADYLTGNGKEYKAKSIEELDIDSILEFEDLLVQLPVQSRDKKFKDKTLFELIKMQKEDGLDLIQSGTLRDHDTKITAFCKYIDKHKKDINIDIEAIYNLSSEQACKVFKHDKGIVEKEVREFTIKELNLFIENTYNEQELKKILLSQPRNFWLFALSLFMGFRHEEVLLISVNDIKLQRKNGKNIYYVYLNEDLEWQHLKNKSGHRNVPIPDIIINLGFFDYVNKRIKNNEITLFDFPTNASASTNAFFRRHIQKSLTLKEGEAVQFRSLRKNFEKYLYLKNRTEFDTETTKEKLSGHVANGLKDRYVGRVEPYASYHVVNAIEFEEDINLDTVRKTTNKFYKKVSDLEHLLEQEDFDWETKSRIKPRRVRRVK